MTNSSVHDYTRQTAAILRGLMARYGVTQAEMSAAVGVSQSQLSKMLRGVRPIDIDQLEGMAGALGSSAFAIMKEVEETLAGFDVSPVTNLIFVEDGLRLPKPYGTEGWGSGSVVEPYSGTRKRTNVGPASDAVDLHTVDLSEDYELAATDDDSAVDPSRGEA